MPTYAQLQAEPWWGREVVTAELDWLGDELCRRTGRSRTAAGTKGDRFHLNGAHRSQEWILNSRYCTSRSYTVQSGLSAAQARHVAGFDFTPGDVEAMLAQSKRLMAAVRSGRLEAVRELYCNVDGDRVVDGWDNVRDRAATSDSSHLWHWHLTVDRRRMTDRRLMERIAAIALGDEEEDVAFTKGDLKTLLKTDGVLSAPELHANGEPRSQEEVAANPHWWLETLYLSTYNNIARLRKEVREHGAKVEAALAAAAGGDVVEAVRAELDRAAERERAERAAELGAHRELLVSELAGQHKAAIERAVERLQEVPPEQVRTVLREELAAVRLVPGQPA